MTQTRCEFTRLGRGRVSYTMTLFDSSGVSISSLALLVPSKPWLGSTSGGGLKRESECSLGHQNILPIHFLGIVGFQSHFSSKTVGKTLAGDNLQDTMKGYHVKNTIAKVSVFVGVISVGCYVLGCNLFSTHVPFSRINPY